MLKGALALAIPTRFGQHLTYSKADSPFLEWQSFDHHQNLWLKVTFDSQLKIISTSDEDKGEFLQNLLRKGFELSGEEFRAGKIETHLEFDRSWGLGSSSTLTYLIAHWLGADQMKLHFATQNGSGYDVACASARSALLYRWEKDVHVHPLKLPEVYNQVYFIHLNQKQLSAPEAKLFLNTEHPPAALKRISEISMALTLVNSLEELQSLLREHEAILSALLQKPTVQQKLFPDFRGTVKSLGAWGGDFVMAVGEAPSYFRSKGFHTILSYPEITL